MIPDPVREADYDFPKVDKPYHTPELTYHDSDLGVDYYLYDSSIEAGDHYVPNHYLKRKAPTYHEDSEESEEESEHQYRKRTPRYERPSYRHEESESEDDSDHYSDDSESEDEHHAPAYKPR